jgi:hypothetical protein
VPRTEAKISIERPDGAEGRLPQVGARASWSRCTPIIRSGQRAHDPAAHFDQFAERVVGQGADGGTPPTVTLELTKGVDYSAYADALGNRLQWRYCFEPPTDVHPKLTGPIALRLFPHATGGDPASGLRDYCEFATYNQK